MLVCYRFLVLALSFC